MSNKKLTKRDHFNAILAKYPLTDAEKEFVQHELDLLSRKNASTGEKKLTAAQVENESLKEIILNLLIGNGERMTITEMQKSCADLAEFTTSKMSSLLRQLVEAEKVERIKEKRSTYFRAI